MTQERPERFLKFLTLLLQLEGGEVNDPLDKGGHTKLGVTQATFTDWLIKNKKPTKSVKEITPTQAQDIYFDNYYKRVDFIEDELCHYLMFDLAVNSGPGRVKTCIQEVSNPHDPFAVLQWRRQYYNKIVAADSTQQRFLKGWMNRLKRIQKYYEVA